MINQLLQVGAFMTRFEQDVSQTPQNEIDVDTLRLRIRLSQEEMNEWLEAFTAAPDTRKVKVNKAMALDALADRLYVLLGDAHALGLAYLLPVAFRIVHNSNMSKLWTESEVRILSPDYTVRQVSTVSDRRYLVHDPLGKVLKSPSYQRADLHSLIDELDGQELLDFEHANMLIFGEEPEPDIDEVEQVKSEPIDLDDDNIPF